MECETRFARASTAPAPDLDGIGDTDLARTLGVPAEKLPENCLAELRLARYLEAGEAPR